jgi:hypothetical protein
MSDEAAPMADNPKPAIVRLSINLAPDVAAVLNNLAERKQITVTEAVRRAIAVWNFFETERVIGNRIAIIEDGPTGERIREVVLLD